VTILLDRLPRGEFKFSYLSNAFDLTPSGGGETLRVDRLGARFQMESTFSLRGHQGVALLAKLNQATGQKVRIPVDQPIDIGSPGSSVVVASGSGQTLAVTGLTASYAVQAGQFITLVKSGKRYLHQVVNAVTANGSGAASLTVIPTLRIPLSGGESVEVANPSIEGFLTARENAWSLNSRLRSVTVTVSVTEAE